ncbi:hypothetical protein AAHC03_026454 [Spirometra sp. Aus1]
MSQKSILYVPLRLIKLTALSFRRNPKGAIYLQILSSRTASPSPPVTNGKRRRLTVVSDDSSTDSTEQELTSAIETSSPTIASECARQSMTGPQCSQENVREAKAHVTCQLPDSRKDAERSPKNTSQICNPKPLVSSSAGIPSNCASV